MSTRSPESNVGFDKFFGSAKEAFNEATVNSSLELIQRAQAAQAGMEIQPGDTQNFPSIMNRAIDDIRLVQGGDVKLLPEELRELLSNQFEQASSYQIPNSEEIVRVNEKKRVNC